jgi:integrase
MAKGTIKRRGRSWVLRWDKPRSTDGKRQQGFKSTRGTKKEAEAELHRLMSEQDRGVVYQAPKTTVTEWLTHWLENIVWKQVRVTTLQSYRSYVKTHLIPSIGHMKIGNLQPDDIDQMLTEIIAKGRTANTARHAFVTLQKALRDAERRGVIIANPCRRVDPPQVKEFRVNPPTIQDVHAIIDQVAEPEYKTAFRLSASTGIRRGELAALNWQNIDFDRGVINIAQAAQRTNKGDVEIGEPKTSSGRRGIMIDEHLVGYLKQLFSDQQARVLSGGGAIVDHGWVFPDHVGNLNDPDRLTRVWRKAAKAAGFPGVRLMDLRHHHASFLIAGGTNTKTVQERMGHSTPAFTLARYVHVSEGLQQEAADSYGRAMAAAH